MPKFTVLSRVDASFDYVAEVEAEDAQAAGVSQAKRSGRPWVDLRARRQDHGGRPS